jgi:hypothetical protein
MKTKSNVAWAIAISALAIGAAATVAFALTPANGGSVGGTAIVVDNTAGDHSTRT